MLHDRLSRPQPVRKFVSELVPHEDVLDPVSSLPFLNLPAFRLVSYDCLLKELLEVVRLLLLLSEVIQTISVLNTTHRMHFVLESEHTIEYQEGLLEHFCLLVAHH